MRRFYLFFHCFAVFLILVLAAFPAAAQTQLPPDVREKIDKLATDVLARTGTPSASLVVIKDGQIAYVKAYGDARLQPRLPATPEMRFCLGSVSKPFTAQALLLLQEQGKLSLDDKVSRFIPDLTRANEVTVRQLLSQTSGYQEYWLVDYVPARMMQPIAPRKILDQWGRKPLNFDPGTKSEISDTNYVIAGMIVEKASGMPMYQFLREKLFTPLGMTSATDINLKKLSETEPAGYMRYALGPLRPAPEEGQGWLFGGEELAMTAEDLAKWDISVIEQRLMKPSSYREFETNVLLKNGLGTGYSMGHAITRQEGYRALVSIGDISGFSAANTILPDERLAVAVLANMDAGAPGEITNGVIPLLLTKQDPTAPQKLEQARKIFDSLQRGTVDRSLFTEDANSYFSDLALKDFAAGLAPLGTPQEFVQTERSVSNGLVSRSYQIKFAKQTLAAHTTEGPDGKLDQYSIEHE